MRFIFIMYFFVVLFGFKVVFEIFVLDIYLFGVVFMRVIEILEYWVEN